MAREDKKFVFKKGTKDVETLLGELLDKKIAALQEKDEDFEILEIEEERKPKVPKISRKRSKVKIEENRLTLDDPEIRQEFDETLLAFRDIRTEYKRLDKEIKTGREAILEAMNGNLIYEGDAAVLKITETPQSSVNTETVIEALVDLESEDLDEIKAGVQEILDMARMGLLSISKTGFDRWIKTKGQEAGPFLVNRSPKKVIRVSKK
jgi:hypothetical protein